MEPASLHAGRVYHPAAGGGNMHIGIESRFPFTVAMAWADEWSNAVQHPEAPANFSFLCVKEHVVRTIYECHLPSERPMILTIRDERTALDCFCPITNEEKKRLSAVPRAAEYLFLENMALKLVLEHRQVANWQKTTF